MMGSAESRCPPFTRSISYAVVAAFLLAGTVAIGPGCRKDESRQHFDQARTYFQKGLYAAADREYQKLAVRYPEGPLADRALFEAALIERLYLQDFIKSIKTLHRLHSTYPRSEYAPQALIEIAEIYQEKFSDPVSAIAEYKKALREYGDQVPKATLLFKIGWCHYSMGDFDEATKAFQQILVDYPEADYADEARFQCAYIQYLQGDSEAADAAFRRFIEDFPESPLFEEAVVSVASLLESRGELEASRAFLESVAVRSPQSHIIDRRIEALTTRIENRESGEADP